VTRTQASSSKFRWPHTHFACQRLRFPGQISAHTSGASDITLGHDHASCAVIGHRRSLKASNGRDGDIARGQRHGCRVAAIDSRFITAYSSTSLSALSRPKDTVSCRASQLQDMHRCIEFSIVHRNAGGFRCRDAGRLSSSMASNFVPDFLSFARHPRLLSPERRFRFTISANADDADVSLPSHIAFSSPASFRVMPEPSTPAQHDAFFAFHADTS